jgi:hypothetical protein
MFSESLTKLFKGFGSGFTELHAKLDADTLLDFAIHLNETKYEVEKALLWNSACSQHITHNVHTVKTSGSPNNTEKPQNME